MHLHNYKYNYKYYIYLILEIIWSYDVKTNWKYLVIWKKNEYNV